MMSRIRDHVLMHRRRLWLIAAMFVVLGISLPFTGPDTEPYRSRRLLAGPIMAAGGLALGLGVARLQRAAASATRTEHSEHPTHVYKDGGDYWAECTCGWSGSNRVLEDRARADALDHTPTVPPGIIDSTNVDASSMGLAFATRCILDKSKPVSVMFRIKAPHPMDSGWRFYDDGGMHGEEPLETTVRAVVDCDPTVESLLSTSPPCMFEKSPGSKQFRRTRIEKGSAPRTE